MIQVRCVLRRQKPCSIWGFANWAVVTPKVDASAIADVTILHGLQNTVKPVVPAAQPVLIPKGKEAEITQKVELCSPVTMTDSFISNYYGIDPDKLEEYVFSMSEDATSAETIIIMKVRNEADTEEISAALETVRDVKKRGNEGLSSGPV